jgi:hypothetical protein
MKLDSADANSCAQVLFAACDTAYSPFIYQCAIFRPLE